MNIQAEQKEILGNNKHYYLWAILVPLVFFGIIFLAYKVSAYAIIPDNYTADKNTYFEVFLEHPPGGNNLLINNNTADGYGTVCLSHSKGTGNLYTSSDLPSGTFFEMCPSGGNTAYIWGTATNSGIYNPTIHDYATETDENFTLTINDVVIPPEEPTSSATSTTNQVQTNIFNGFLFFIISFGGFIWFMKQRGL